MRLGGLLFTPHDDSVSWAAAVCAAGYGAAYCPIGPEVDEHVARAYADAAAKNDIVIAEVGTWSNPLSTDDRTRRDAHARCVKGLAFADFIGARCCVNIAGSRGEKWDGHHDDNLTQAGFDRVVESVRSIIDAVKPARTFYTLEPMPWMFPDSADSYLELIRAVDRKAFAVHLDPVNIISSPRLYYRNAALLRECFSKLGPYIKSCHAKDIVLGETLTVHLSEARPGLGQLDYRTYLTELDKLDRSIPLMFEHMTEEQDYILAGEYVRKLANELEITFDGPGKSVRAS